MCQQSIIKFPVQFHQWLNKQTYRTTSSVWSLQGPRVIVLGVLPSLCGVVLCVHSLTSLCSLQLWLAGGSLFCLLTIGLWLVDGVQDISDGQLLIALKSRGRQSERNNEFIGLLAHWSPPQQRLMGVRVLDRDEFQPPCHRREWALATMVLWRKWSETQIK